MACILLSHHRGFCGGGFTPPSEKEVPYVSHEKNARGVHSHDAKAGEFDSSWTDSLPDVDFRSAGADGQFGTDDDLSNSKR